MKMRDFDESCFSCWRWMPMPLLSWRGRWRCSGWSCLLVPEGACSVARGTCLPPSETSRARELGPLGKAWPQFPGGESSGLSTRTQCVTQGVSCCPSCGQEMGSLCACPALPFQCPPACSPPGCFGGRQWQREKDHRYGKGEGCRVAPDAQGSWGHCCHSLDLNFLICRMGRLDWAISNHCLLPTCPNKYTQSPYWY